MVGVTSRRTSWNRSTRRRLRVWQASSARTRSSGLVAAAPSMIIRSTGSTRSQASVPIRSAMGPQVVGPGQHQPRIDRVLVEHGVDFDHLGPEVGQHVDGPLAQSQYLVVDLGVAEGGRPGHPGRWTRVVAGRPATTPRVGATTAGRTGRGPTTTSRAATRSASFRAIGPLVDRFCQSGDWDPPDGTRPSDGFIPDSPQADDGIRSEPPPSEPVASGTMPEAMAAALPPDEPPAVCSRFHGLRVAPNSGFSVSGLPSEFRACWSCPTTTHPAATSRATRTESCGGRRPVGIGGRAVGGHIAGRVLQVLHPDGDAGQRAGVLTAGHQWRRPRQRPPGPGPRRRPRRR